MKLRSVNDVVIDHSMVHAIKRGDLSILQGEVYRCTPADPSLQGIPLILKRIDCVDRRIYDAKVYEFDTYIRLRGPPNLVSLFSYWSERAPSPYFYKTLVGLFEQATVGDMLQAVVQNAIRPSSRLCLKYLCDMAKGLATLHAGNIVHGNVKPSSVLI